MGNDPQYVRLVDRMARSTQVDLNSGWSIAGLDVRPFPEDDEPAAQKYVREAIRRGTIEGCSQAEYEEVYGEEGTNNLDFLEQAGYERKPPEVQEEFQVAGVRALADQARHRIEAARGLSSDGRSFKDERIRTAAILRAQRAQDEGEEPAEKDAAGEAHDEELVEQISSEEETDEQEAAEKPPRKTAAKKAAPRRSSRAS